jgi:hypothetical protein
MASYATIVANKQGSKDGLWPLTLACKRARPPYYKASYSLSTWNFQNLSH